MEKATGLADQLKNWQVHENYSLNLKDLEEYLLSIFVDRAKDSKGISVQIWFSSEEDAEKWFNEIYNPALQETAKKHIK